MSAEELITEARRHVDRFGVTTATLLVDRLADALEAAIARQPRTIETVEDLDALPVGAVLRDNMTDVWDKVSLDSWEQTATEGRWSRNWVALPAAVLFEPDKEA